MSEHYVGTVRVNAHGAKYEKAVYVNGWRGPLYCKNKGTYNSYVLLVNGTLGKDYSWTDLILFDPWQRVAGRRVVRVIHLIEATKERLLR